MRFTSTHAQYCGIDLHAKTMYLCILDQDGQILLHENMRSRPEAFLAAVEPFREDLAVAVECMFTWFGRFERVQDFLSYSRLVKCDHSSAGKKLGTGSAKIGNVHLKWAFSEAAALFLRNNPEGQRHLRSLAGRHGKAKAMSEPPRLFRRPLYVSPTPVAGTSWLS